MPTGLVVAGGYSTRCGLAEKALLEVGDEPMLRRVVEALDPVVEDVVIDCRADQVAPFETALERSPVEPRFVVDGEPDAGPIAGLATGFAAVESAETVVVSCDRPGVTPALFDQLLRTRREADVAAALPAVDGCLQPLCGVYRTAALRDAVRAAVRAGDRRLCRIPRGLSRSVVSGEALAAVVEPTALRSVDTHLEARLHRARHPTGPSERAASDSAGRESGRTVATDGGPGTGSRD